ncbi:DUF2871 family protein [Tessaracoccus massiliensis]|uniref:DUF2871 family protein n=1 Tax=Tessaracoccus massiliensis TaxID=1522311 RepID=UPI0006949D0F|nr:DUF2871 family protein [Tessaracoccus massiliensis]
MLNRLFFSAAAWTGLGLLSGLYWREFTKLNEFTGETMLSTAHTHALALGALVFLAALALAKVFPLAEKSGKLFALLYNIGMAFTFGAMVVKGTLQVLEAPIATSAMWPGFAGLGHMLISGTFVYFFIILRRAMKADATVGASAATVGA